MDGPAITDSVGGDKEKGLLGGGALVVEFSLQGKKQKLAWYLLASFLFSQAF